MNRSTFLSLIEASLTADRPDYAQTLAHAWLEHWHNDIAVRFGLARALAAQYQWQPAHAILVDLVASDPEQPAMQLYLARLSLRLELHNTAERAYVAVSALSGRSLPSDVHAPRWLAPVQDARRAVTDKRYTEAIATLEPLAPSELPSPLAGLTLVNAKALAGLHTEAGELTAAYLKQWPETVALMLFRAAALMQAGQHEAGVAWLHEASANDPAGDVVRRVWGGENPYRALWPPELDFGLPSAVPSAVAGLMGLNGLPAPRTGPAAGAERHNKASQKAGQSPELREIEAELRKIEALVARKRGKRHQSDTKQADVEALERDKHIPVHVILTSRTRLQEKFGTEAARKVLAGLRRLLKVREQAVGQAQRLLLLDDGEGLAELGLHAVDPLRSWDIKHLLAELDQRLRARSERIGSLLLVGGDDVVPFHRLPNPVDDADREVLSDNPYGSPDDNYFIPAWPVGRLPSPCGGEPGPLLRLINTTIDAIQRPPPIDNWLQRLVWRMLGWQRTAASLGYSAAVWRQPSESVFRFIGKRTGFFTSPPSEVPNVPDPIALAQSLAYFNLHGLADSPDWYGQRDATDEQSPMYPVALRPGDVPNGGKAPRLVFSEACYGANIENKRNPSEALCLHFLNAGSQAVIGSTKIAYGSVRAPLIGADLLGAQFWRAVLAGNTVGESLRLARLSLADIMNKRQGFLDGEDQKTLISFVLYGDPLLHAPGVPRLSKQAQAKSMSLRAAPKMLTCTGVQPMDDAEARAAEPARDAVAKYLPGMKRAQMQVLYPHATDPANAKLLGADPGQRVYALSKTISIDKHIAEQYARVTVNGSGQVVKISVSR